MSGGSNRSNSSSCSGTKGVVQTIAPTASSFAGAMLSFLSYFARAEWSAPAISLIALVALFSLISEPFRQPENFYNIGLQAPITVIIAVGQTLVIAAGGIDLSVGSVLALASVIAAWLINRGCDPAVGLLVAILIGCICGAINGALITVGRLPAFVATLGMMSVARGLAHPPVQA